MIATPFIEGCGICDQYVQHTCNWASLIRVVVLVYFVPWSHFLNGHTNGSVQFVDVRKLMCSSQITKRCEELKESRVAKKYNI